ALTFSLSQNYPNPFNPTTKINFSIPESGLVQLKVYNLLGEVITILVNEEKQAGKHEVQFNASNLSSGIYLYTLRAGNYVDTYKMLLLR
ncbi:MAG: T9SS type A sorting domain-containing protein, partial [Ignavibacteriaceae bacterium]